MANHKQFSSLAEAVLPEYSGTDLHCYRTMPRAARAARGSTSGMPPTPSADKISAEEFRTNLILYDCYVKPISDQKGAKPSEKTLSELDRYRYGDAIDQFGGDTPKKQMGLEDVKMLVSWKLKHGKFRPTLMKLVSSNDSSSVEDIIQEAVELYRKSSNISGALKILTKLRGIGPATASLLLAVLDPDRVIFFADEAYYWLCCGGKQADIKYNAKEYEDLSARAHELCKRLNVRAVDVEKVAYVMMRRKETEDINDAEKSEPSTAASKTREDLNPRATTNNTNGHQAGKRKARSDEDEKAEGDKISPPPPARRSKRIQRGQDN